MTRRTWTSKGFQYYIDNDGQLWERSLTIPFNGIGSWRKSRKQSSR